MADTTSIRPKKTPSKTEERIFIKMCIKTGKSPMETKQLLDNAGNG